MKSLTMNPGIRQRATEIVGNAIIQFSRAGFALNETDRKKFYDETIEMLLRSRKAPPASQR